MHNIFACFADKDDDSRRPVYTSWFVDAFPPTEFDGDELLFYYYMEYCTVLGVSCKRKYLEIWCATELRRHISSSRVKVPGCESINMDDPLGFEEIVKVSQQVLLDDFDALCKVDTPVIDFPVECAKFMNDRKTERIVAILSKSFDKLQTTNDATAAGDYAMSQLELVDSIYDESILEDLVSGRAEREPLEFITDYGIPAIDTDSGGIYTTQLVDVEAQSGAGKTRFMLGHPAYNAAVKYHKNVIIYALEQSIVELENMLIARHIFALYGIQITDSAIARDQVPEEYKSYVEAARIDLFESGKYGKIVIREDMLYVESIIRTITMHDKLLGPFDLFCIDYVGIIESKPEAYHRELTIADIISTSLKLLKRFARKRKRGVLTVSQFNADGVRAGKADKEISTDMAQGGMSVYRHTDYNIAMSMTDEMRAMGKRRFSQPKVRSSTGFGTFICSVWLGVCYFQQDTKKAV